MKKKIVVVEDDEDLSLILKSILNNAGYQVSCMGVGSPIVNNDYDLPDLFIFDIRMKVIDGRALCKFLKLNSRTKEIPVILISGYHEYRQKALDIGADDFLPKPLNIDRLLQTVDTLTSRATCGTTDGG